MNADLHALLDSLTDGENVKATWSHDQRTVTVEGPVYIIRREVWCDRSVRREDGEINSTLTSIEVVRDEEVTVTRDDEAALHALLDSLTDGQDVTAEWRNGAGAMTITGKVRTSGGTFRELVGYHTEVMRWNGGLDRPLHSVTAHRATVRRWERDGDE